MLLEIKTIQRTVKGKPRIYWNAYKDGVRIAKSANNYHTNSIKRAIQDLAKKEFLISLFMGVGKEWKWLLRTTNEKDHVIGITAHEKPEDAYEEVLSLLEGFKID